MQSVYAVNKQRLNSIVHSLSLFMPWIEIKNRLQATWNKKQ